MMRTTLLGAALLGCIAWTVHASSPEPAKQSFDLRWQIQVDKVPQGTRQARVWIALPQELEEQHVAKLKVKADAPWKFVEDETFHNKVALVTVSDPAASFAIDLEAQVLRFAVDAPRRAKLSDTERALYLRPEALVSLSPKMRALADSIGGSERTRYDFVLTRMDYDKTAPGWGQGDSERACVVGKGNCTDFHSLFMSLSRAKGVPTRFEMGYSTLPAGEQNRAGGYHCWAWFYDDAQKAWVPVDISEADKHPEKTEYFFGQLDADRITFSRGRAVRLPEMKGEPLNYLPASAYVEADGKPLNDAITRTLSYTVDEAFRGD